ncbi:hypothetical protein [Azospira sp. I13]|nr:hypothetical protein [Azospira sp. I13]
MTFPVVFRRTFAGLQRLHLALRYWRCLGYTWHLAWLKAAR